MTNDDKIGLAVANVALACARRDVAADDLEMARRELVAREAEVAARTAALVAQIEEIEKPRARESLGAPVVIPSRDQS